MKQGKRILGLGLFTAVAMGAINTFAHRVPGDVLHLHNGVTHPGIGITHVITFSVVAVSAWMLARAMAGGR